jgi:hypothetical protein
LFLSLSLLLSNLRKDCWSGIIVIAAVGVGVAAGELSDFSIPLATAPLTAVLVVVTAAAAAAAATVAVAAGLAGKKNDSISEVAPVVPIWSDCGGLDDAVPAVAAAAAISPAAITPAAGGSAVLTNDVGGKRCRSRCRKAKS